MNQQDIAENIVTRREIAERANVPERNLSRWIDRRQSNAFPPYLKKVGRGVHGLEVYWWPDVEAWIFAYFRTRNGAKHIPPMGDGEPISQRP